MKKDSRIFLLESKLRDREFEIAMLKETAAAVSSELDLDKVFQVVADHARKLVLSETILVPVLNDNRSDYTYRAGCGKLAGEIVGRTLSRDVGLCSWIWKHRRPLWHGAREDLNGIERTAWEQEAESVVVVPLIGKRRFLGGITGINKIGGSDFTQRDLDLLILFASQVSYAIENAELFNELNRSMQQTEQYQHDLQMLNAELERRVAQRTSALADAVKELEHLALHDMLTDLPNRSLIEDRLQQAIHVAKREQKLVSFMIIDLNRFKEINDKHGHGVGDSLLQQIALRLRRVLRQSDTAGRLGGDEFAIVLPATDAEGAQKVAKKLTKVLEPSFQVGKHVIDCACSIGIAVYPQHGADVATLNQCADAALAVAKRGGLDHTVYRAESTPKERTT